jgi:hypothetical protein
VRDRSSLTDRLEQLKGVEDPRRRGDEYEPFVASVFRRSHFTVTQSPGLAPDTQIDMIATRHDESYLIETKWLNKPVGRPQIVLFLDRLASAPPSMTGLFIAYPGFTKGAIHLVESRTDTPILLVTGDELDREIQWDGHFLRMLRQKRSAMQTDGRSLFLTGDRTQLRPAPTGSLPSSAETFVLGGGERSHSLKCGGDYGQFTFVQEMPDIDWTTTPGAGVSFDVRLPMLDQEGLIAVIDQLSDMHWITDKARWSIQQADTNWHGTGAAAFADSLSDWENRYKDLEQVHHTEEFCFFDAMETGEFFTLTGQLSADEMRFSRRTSLSFQLYGVPLDTSSFHHLCEKFHAEEGSFFRPKHTQSVTSHRLFGDDRIILDVLGHICEDDDLFSDPDEREWVVGIVAKNPYPKTQGHRRQCPDWWPEMARDTECLVCALSHWHPRSRPKDIYRLKMCESAWTSDAQIVCLVADWDDDQPQREMELPPRSFESRVTTVVVLPSAAPIGSGEIGPASADQPF